MIAPALVAAYACTLGVPGERRAAGAVTLAGVALLAGSVPLAGDLSWQDASRIGSVPAAPLVAGLVGHAARTRRAYLAAVEERARRAEESRELEARRRVAEERVRIARELHDLVAHQITLANAQATVAAHFFDSRPEQTRVSLRELVETTGQALDELRATVGLLRQTGDTDSGVPEGPAPGLARLPDLLESFRRAGLEVAVREEGRARALPPGVDLTAYRIVQEALTNVTKHASGRGARVGLDWGGGRLTVTVTDDGGAPSGPPPCRTGPRLRPDRPAGTRHCGGRRPEGGPTRKGRLPGNGPPALAAHTGRGDGRGGPHAARGRRNRGDDMTLTVLPAGDQALLRGALRPTRPPTLGPSAAGVGGRTRPADAGTEGVQLADGQASVPGAYRPPPATRTGPRRGRRTGADADRGPPDRGDDMTLTVLLADDQALLRGALRPTRPPTLGPSAAGVGGRTRPADAGTEGVQLADGQASVRGAYRPPLPPARDPAAVGEQGRTRTAGRRTEGTT